MMIQNPELKLGDLKHKYYLKVYTVLMLSTSKASFFIL
jgi:hypothetical protein